MNTLLSSNKCDRHIETSVKSSMVVQAFPNLAIIPIFPAPSQTRNSQPIPNSSASRLPKQTTNSLSSVSQSFVSLEDNRTALNELKKMSGLSWEQLARLFDVSRRTLHFWASGQSLSRSNEENLYRLLGTIRYLNRGSARATRTVLLSPNKDGQIPFDLLQARRYEEVKQLLGAGNVPQRTELLPLSKEARLARSPQKPEDLIDALNDPIHREVGRERPSIAVRSSQGDRTN